MERLLSFNYLLVSGLIGLVLGSTWPDLPSRAGLAGFGILSLILLLLYVRLRLPLLLYGAACLWGFCAAIFHGQQIYAGRLPEAMAGSDWLVEAVVTGLPERTEQGERFDVHVERVLQNSLSRSGAVTFVPVKLRLNYYEQKRDPAGSGKDFYFQPGQRWQFWVRLKPPRGFVNDGGFDYEGWLLEQRYNASGYVRETVLAQRLPDQVCDVSIAGLRACMDRLAFGFLQWIYGYVHPQHRALFAALTIGYGEDFDHAQWDILKNTGTIHLVVVSGFHISLLAWLGYGLFSWLSRILFVPLQWIAAPVWGAMGASVWAVFYALLSGFTLPVQRALVMVLCGLAAWLLRTRISVSSSFLLGCVLVFCLDPLALFSTSFWLSFGAVAILLYVFAARIYPEKKSSVISLWFKTQCCISIGMVPLLAYGIGSVPINSFISNLVAVPYITFVVLPLVILVLLSCLWSPTLAEALLPLSHSSMDFFWWLLRQCEGMNKILYFSAGDIAPWCITGISLLAVIVLWAPRGIFSLRYYPYILSFCLFIPLFFPWREKIPAGEFSVTVLDVGQGLSVLIETRGGVTVYDTGDKFSDQFDIGRDLVAQQIRRRGYNHLDTLIISHGDSDHAGGLEGLLGALPVERLFSGDPELVYQRMQENLPGLTVGVEACRAGQHWYTDGVSFQVLSPEEPSLIHKRNNRSCVVRVSSAHHSLLLSGDIHEDQERWLLAHVEPAVLNSDVLLVPHHGSKSSSSDTFIEGISPGVALASVGYHSRYGHPHEVVMERYARRGIAVIRSDLEGAVTLSSVDGFQEIYSARQQSGRYWHRW